MNLNNIYKNKTDSWASPKYILDLFFGFGYGDPCPLDDNGIDALFVDWPRKSYVNPPFSNIMGFVNKALLDLAGGYIDCCWMLLPVRTGTVWIKRLYDFGSSFYFIRGRLAFGKSSTPAPFDCMLVNLKPKRKGIYFVERDQIVKTIGEVLKYE